MSTPTLLICTSICTLGLQSTLSSRVDSTTQILATRRCSALLLAVTRTPSARRYLDTQGTLNCKELP